MTDISNLDLGVPSATYVKLLRSKAMDPGSDAIIRNNCIYFPNDSQQRASVESMDSKYTKYEVIGNIFDESISNDQFCRHILRNQSCDLSRLLVKESKNVAIFSIGSKKTKKGMFLKKHLFPQLSSELFAAINIVNNTMLISEVQVTDFRMTLSSFDMRDEEMFDLLRPGNSLSLTPSSDGMKVKGLHQQIIIDEHTLLSCLQATCENRSNNLQLTSSNTKDSCIVWNIELTQTDVDSTGVHATNKCNLLIIDLPNIDALLNESMMSNAGIKSRYSAYNPLLAFVEKIRKMSFAVTESSSSESMTSSNLTSYLAEVLGGDYHVIGLVSLGRAVS
jgi:hypothetical protein